MPTYTYCCTVCGDMDISHSIHDSGPISCPECGTEGLTRRFQSVGIKFSGSGFYSTDSRGK